MAGVQLANQTSVESSHEVWTLEEQFPGDPRGPGGARELRVGGEMKNRNDIWLAERAAAKKAAVEKAAPRKAVAEKTVVVKTTADEAAVEMALIELQGGLALEPAQASLTRRFMYTLAACSPRLI